MTGPGESSNPLPSGESSGPSPQGSRAMYDADEHEAHLRPMVPLDLGHDHAMGWTPTGDIYWLHRCDGDDYRGDQPWRWALGTIDVTSGERHALRKRLPVDIGGSVLCGCCGDHGFINDGQWVKA